MYQICDKIDGIRDIIHHVRIKQRFLICQKIGTQTVHQKQGIDQVDAVRNLHIPDQYRQEQSYHNANQKYYPGDHYVTFLVKRSKKDLKEIIELEYSEKEQEQV